MVKDFSAINCPIPLQRYPHILMAHGGGGRLMHQLIEEMFLATFQPETAWRHDAASLTLPGERIAFTTDSYVVTPLFFPGGDIGSLSVYGTVNDLAMAGAKPRYLSLSFILEEGLPIETLWQVVQSIQSAAKAAQVQIVTGDTKVVEQGKGDGLYINTAGIGTLAHDGFISPSEVRPGDAIIVSGDVGRHGIAILSAREGLGFETSLGSDVAPLSTAVLDLLSQVAVHCLRDLTRGGLAIALNEIASAANTRIDLTAPVPVHEEVQAACELLGLDPLYTANEGRFVAFVPATEAAIALACLQKYNQRAAMIGTVSTQRAGEVIIRSAIGTQRVVEYRSGEQLPRIC